MIKYEVNTFFIDSLLMRSIFIFGVRRKMPIWLQNIETLIIDSN